ncbi:unnamed protein product [Lactuca virosa]|uniref:Uncharacterized protein n=1 Tax=Lactuca virosa TaxID=75947 RepID=A0AAU9M8D9_9ASTR|nr:unnamed protein product [Lactuca virosa]
MDPDVMADGYGSRVYNHRYVFADDPFCGGRRQSAEASPRSDVFPPRNAIIQHCSLRVSQMSLRRESSAE